MIVPSLPEPEPTTSLPAAFEVLNVLGVLVPIPTRPLASMRRRSVPTDLNTVIPLAPVEM